MLRATGVFGLRSSQMLPALTLMSTCPSSCPLQEPELCSERDHGLLVGGKKDKRKKKCTLLSFGLFLATKPEDIFSFCSAIGVARLHYRSVPHLARMLIGQNWLGRMGLSAAGEW